MADAIIAASARSPIGRAGKGSLKDLWPDDLTSNRDLNIDIDRLNLHGGAIAVGHPFCMTGARLTGTLINGLAFEDKHVGLVTVCVGGGQGMAMILERLT